MKYLIPILLVTFFVLQSNTCKKKHPDCPDGSHNGITVVNNSARTISPDIYWIPLQLESIIF